VSLKLEALEARDVPAFAFAFDSSVPTSYYPAFEVAGRELATRVVGEYVVPVTVQIEAGILARAGPGVGILINTDVAWHLGTTPLGLSRNEMSLSSVVKHELFHFLGVLTHAEQGESVRSPTLSFGADYTVFEADYDMLRAIGYGVTPRGYPEFALYSLATTAGVLQYAVGPWGALFLGNTGQQHIQFADYDFDGDLDVRVIPVGPGTEYIFDAAGNVSSAPAFGPTLLYRRY
jgi:hypothetical protein